MDCKNGNITSSYQIIKEVLFHKYLFKTMKHFKNVEKPKENYKLHIFSIIKVTSITILSYFFKLQK